MAIIETKEIGIDIGVGIGTFVNTEYVDGGIQLAQTDVDADGNPVYELEGYWQSNVIDMVDKFKEYDRVAVDVELQFSDVYAILTRVSDDGVNFSEYVATTPEGKIQSELKRYIQIRLDFYAGLASSEKFVSEFSSPEEVHEWENNEHIETDGVLKLKHDYEFNMNKDESWNEEGSLHTIQVVKSDWKQINSLNIG